MRVSCGCCVLRWKGSGENSSACGRCANVAAAADHLRRSEWRRLTAKLAIVSEESAWKREIVVV